MKHLSKHISTHIINKPVDEKAILPSGKISCPVSDMKCMYRKYIYIYVICDDICHNFRWTRRLVLQFREKKCREIIFARHMMRCNVYKNICSYAVEI